MSSKDFQGSLSEESEKVAKETGQLKSVDPPTPRLWWTG
jgi:hypothetical protein